VTVRIDFPILNRLGLHARASARFVSIAARFPCQVWVERDGQRVNGKSIMGLMTLAATQGSTLQLETSGEAEQECAEALLALTMDRFGEGE